MSHSACWCEWVILVTLHVREKNKQENKQEEMEVFSFICPCFFLVPSENFHLGGGGHCENTFSGRGNPQSKIDICLQEVIHSKINRHKRLLS